MQGESPSDIISSRISCSVDVIMSQNQLMIGPEGKIISVNIQFMVTVYTDFFIQHFTKNNPKNYMWRPQSASNIACVCLPLILFPFRNNTIQSDCGIHKQSQ